VGMTLLDFVMIDSRRKEENEEKEEKEAKEEKEEEKIP
jgi:hypothetical protein